jgi:tetratricopeptide (TPR) repeat protein
MSAASKSKPSRAKKAELSLVHIDTCFVCDLVTEEVVTCHGCHQRDYCSRACQKIDWGLHRHMCLRKTNACEMCGEKEGLNSCTGCFQRKYCSEECQARAWKEHKALCKAYQTVGLEVTNPEELAVKLSDYAVQLGISNLRESQLRVRMEILAFCKSSKLDADFTISAMANLSSTLSAMSRFPEAEIFAREMVAESEKVTPVRDIHLIAAQFLSSALINQGKHEEGRVLAHDALEQFGPIVPEGEFMVRLMETESTALAFLERHKEALALSRHCFKVRTDHPERFDSGGKVPFNSYATLAQCLSVLGQLDEAEVTLKKALAVLESDGKQIHPEVVTAMDALGQVYLLQGRKKEAAAMARAVKKLVPQVFPKDHPGCKQFKQME